MLSQIQLWHVMVFNGFLFMFTVPDFPTWQMAKEEVGWAIVAWFASNMLFGLYFGIREAEKRWWKDYEDLNDDK